jgi:adenosine deaminase
MLFGLDLVGDEAYFDYEFYAPIFRDWNAAGKMTRAHVSESQRAENGLHAITHLGVTNIAHGLKMMKHPEMIALARDHGTTFDLGISSNYLTGVWTSSTKHPVNVMLENGLRTTLGTDDPVQCSSTLDGEFLLTRQFGVTDMQRQFMRRIAEENTRRYVRVAA